MVSKEGHANVVITIAEHKEPTEKTSLDVHELSGWLVVVWCWSSCMILLMKLHGQGSFAGNNAVC